MKLAVRRTKARAAFLEKEPGSSDPLDFRLLLIMSTFYRRWAALRLKQLMPWIMGWSLKEIFAGAEPQGACDATYGIGLMLEEFRLDNVPFCGGTADISKFFDQSTF